MYLRKCLLIKIIITQTHFYIYVYKLSYIDNLDEMEERNIRWCFHGHTHIPHVYYRSKHTDHDSNEEKQILKDYQHALICPGSIGQPRNMQPGAQIAFIDLENEELELHNISYDMTSLLNDMKKFDFPEQLISRLIKGQ